MSYAIYFDTETGGVADDSPVIQLAAVAIDESTWLEVGTFERKIHFDESKADPEALALNHYDRAVWQKEAVPEFRACQNFATFCGPWRSLTLISKRTGNPYQVAKLIGHNAAPFDAPRLKRMFERWNMFAPWDPRVRDTLQLALWYFDRVPGKPANYKVSGLCEFFGLPVIDAHDALGDVRMTVQIAKRLREEEAAKAAA